MKKIIVAVIVLVFTLGAKAQEESGLKFSVGADLVSSYVWRGALGSGASIQPSAGLEIGGFSLSAWGSTDITLGLYKEVDFTAAYSIGGLSLAVTDYWWEGEGEFKYFNYKKETTDHLWEATVGYTLPTESFPLSLTVNTFFAGADALKAKNGKRAYSTYIEANLPFSVKEIGLEAALALTPGESIYASKASVVNLSLKAGKEIKITDSFSMPVFGQIIVNPRSEGIFFVFGVSL
ncbi:hypothetical protein FACS189432_00120 [Bacteroidia bacterium]|nr:hypothetical protein FACS189426_01660 [Bacteroidia bacterium]GHT26201.1 hypothetical protein FACS189432_00120 [Bacteroidia bacterium]